ncbi:MAG: hypothetical protein JEZ07_06055 [Phycisphaerae bacterium]|nr:hypothetical protein [Phycisphaerae bacterium]
MPTITPLTHRQNILKTVFFDKPDYIPMVFHINESCWDHYPNNALNDLMAEHKFLFPDYQKGPGRAELDYQIIERIGKPFIDGWGCTWETAMNGIVGTVTKHPLANWDNFGSYIAPNPETDSGKGPHDWNEISKNLASAKANGQLTMGGLRHGHTFMQLADIRGYEALMFDMFDDKPELAKLIKMVEEFNMAIVKKYIELGVEWISYAEDLGMQNGPMLQPKHFRKYIKPSYERLIAPAKKAGCIIHMHSDGHLHALIDDIIDGGVNAVNLQDLVNGIDWIKNKLAGKICIDLDIDRQSITPYGTPEQIDALIKEEVKKLGSKEGGLMMIYGLYPGVPLDNVKALMDAMEKYAFYYSSL